MFKARKDFLPEELYSPALEIEQCLAKTLEMPDGTMTPGIDVLSHCKIVGLVAKEIVSRMPNWLQEKYFPPGVELIAAAHDVGKVNPHFQKKLLQACTYPPHKPAWLKFADPNLEKEAGYHSGISQSELLSIGKHIAEIAGAHHGKPQNPVKIKNDTDEILGGIDWHCKRQQLIHQLELFFGVPWPDVNNDLHALIYTGLTTVSDWIGSGSIFAYINACNFKNIEDEIKHAVDKAGFIQPKLRSNLSFLDLFQNYSPRPIQQAFIDLVTEPGIYILEEEMGQGKTEAALAVAYNLMSTGKANGIYFALPTQLTSEKIYERFTDFLSVILDSADNHRANLLHGKSWFYELEFGEDARPGYSWFQPKKRGMLAPFGVGTIDQALMAVMNVKHGFVRTFGLVGKVVIIDEVHSYDSYTGTILDQLVTSLEKLGCTVIILSATLTDHRKKELLKKTNVNNQFFLKDYPVITGKKSGVNNQVFMKSFVRNENRIVDVCICNENKLAILEVQKRASEGQYVLWIENTVKEAQEIFKLLSAWSKTNNIDCGLLHSQFSLVDRQKIESKWVTLYGKQGRSSTSLAMGSGKILVGTQVLEQSLDIDADYLVTKIAPTDMLLQRIGRLWRHRDNDKYRPDNAFEQVCLLMPTFEELSEKGKVAFGDSAYVYSPYVLHRTFEVWNSKEEIVVPKDMRELIEATYSERDEIEDLAQLLFELKEGREKLQRFANLGLARSGITWDDNALTRFSEQETRDVLLIKRCPTKDNPVLIFLDGERITFPPNQDLTNEIKRKISKKIHERLFSVSVKKIPKAPKKTSLKWLQPYLFLGNKDESLVIVALVHESGEIRALDGTEMPGNRDYYYLESIGYQVRKKEGV